MTSMPLIEQHIRFDTLQPPMTIHDIPYYTQSYTQYYTQYDPEFDNLCDTFLDIIRSTMINQHIKKNELKVKDTKSKKINKSETRNKKKKQQKLTKKICNYLFTEDKTNFK